MADGWIKVHRKIWEKGWASKPEYISVWLYILTESTHKKIERMWNGKTIILSPGQFITGRLKIAENTGVHQSKVERILKTFEIEQQIEQRKTSTSRLISVTNWDRFQKDEQRFEQRVNNEWTTSEQRVNTIQEGKERKECKERKKKNFSPPTLDEVLKYFDQNGYTEKAANTAFQYYHTAGWVDSKGNKVLNWKQKMISVWFKDEHRKPQSRKATHVA